ncbi:MAG: transglutaminase-like domain-containing protein [Elusimicrobia bacterium]|nr:transglutaminase-like domain-containing protein [Elusimicrobiota bacterium]
MKYALISVILLASACPAGAQFRGERPDYGKPELYLKQGTQSFLSSGTAAQISGELALPSGADHIRTLSALYFWLMDAFTGEALGGRTVGKTTAEGLIKNRKLGGCHDYALVFSAALRTLGYPALMADAASIRWAKGYKPGSATYGHVFVEVYAGGKWLLVDAVTGRMILDYDPSNPVIPLYLDREPKGFYALMKGPDPEAYGVNSIDSLHRAMEEFAQKLPVMDISYPQYDIVTLSRYSPPVQTAAEEQLTGPCGQGPCHGLKKTGMIMQLGGHDLHLEKTGAGYAAHLYPYGKIFTAGETRTMTFPDLRALNAYLKELQADD